jgi:O-antigen/teichoic acid export membrane protein
MSLAQRSIRSSAYNIAANAVEIVVLFVRSVVLARLLDPAVFGVYTLALSVVALTQALPSFGLMGAFLYQTDESESEEALGTHFALTTLFGVVWAFLLTIGVALFAPEDVQWVYRVLIATALVSRLTLTPCALLTRQVLFRRLAILQVSTTLVTTLISISLAWHGFGVWSLVAANVVGAAIAVIALYAIRPVWRPQLGWSPPMVRRFLSFGSKVVTGNLLLQTLDRVDDIWTGVVLGPTALGYYSRAYRFATYPRAFLARPLNSVAIGTYAQLKGDRRRLSQAFFRINSLMIRTGFLLAGVLALVAPEFIRLVLGAQWLPMLDAFRLMLVYTLLDPIKITIANVITTSGAPEKVIRARITQMVVMSVGLVTLGPWLGIAGVALTVNLMLVIGIGILLWQARTYIDFSIRRMFAVPTLGLVLGLLATRAAIAIPGILGSDWLSGILKAIVFSATYLGVVLLLERDQIPMLLGMLKQLRRSSQAWA